MKIRQVKKWFMTAFVGILALCSMASVPFGKTGVALLSSQGGAAMDSLKLYAAQAANCLTGTAMPRISLHLEQEKSIPDAAQRWWLPEKNHDGVMPGSQVMRAIEAQPQPISKISGILLHTDRASINKILQSEEYRGSG